MGTVNDMKRQTGGASKPWTTTVVVVADEHDGRVESGVEKWRTDAQPVFFTPTPNLHR
jgi:hypothetical protein